MILCQFINTEMMNAKSAILKNDRHFENGRHLEKCDHILK